MIWDYVYSSRQYWFVLANAGGSALCLLPTLPSCEAWNPYYFFCKIANFNKILHSSMVIFVYFWLVLDRFLPKVDFDIILFEFKYSHLLEWLVSASWVRVGCFCNFVSVLKKMEPQGFYSQPITASPLPGFGLKLVSIALQAWSS